MDMDYIIIIIIIVVLSNVFDGKFEPIIYRLDVALGRSGVEELALVGDIFPSIGGRSWAISSYHFIPNKRRIDR